MKTLRRTLKYARPFRRYFWTVIIAVFFLSVLVLATPIAVRELVNSIEYSVMHGYDDTRLIWIIAGILLGIYALRILLHFIIGFLGHKYTFLTMRRLRYDMYSHLQGMSPKFYQDKQVGSIVYRIMDEVFRMDNLLAHVIFDFIIGILTFVTVTTVLFIMNPFLAMLVMIPLPVLFTVAKIQRKMRRHNLKAKKHVGELYGLFTDNLHGMKEIQIFGKQDYELERADNLNAKINDHVLKGQFWSSLLKPLMEFMSGIGKITVLLVGGILALQGSMPIGDVMAFMLFMYAVYTPIAQLPRILEDGTDSLTSLSRAYEYLDTMSDVQERENAIEVGNLNGNVEFKNVTFGYGDKPVLNDISFTAGPGTMVALVGHTGAGKTTITALLARFYDIQKGSIKIDGTDIGDMTLQSLRNNLSIVLQDVFLFNGTIAENISYGRKDSVTHEELVSAARSACIHDFIEGLPDKYNTEVGERGVRLSGGQKQRIAIARALLRNSSILILDEATSSIDNTTEREIQAAINNLSRDKSRTIIVIAHRLSTIEKADKILFLENGKVIEQGTHDELLAKGGAYTKLVHAQ